MVPVIVIGHEYISILRCKYTRMMQIQPYDINDKILRATIVMIIMDVIMDNILYDYDFSIMHVCSYRNMSNYRNQF